MLLRKKRFFFFLLSIVEMKSLAAAVECKSYFVIVVRCAAKVAWGLEIIK